MCLRYSSLNIDKGCMDSREERSYGAPQPTTRILRVNRKFNLRGISESPTYPPEKFVWFQTRIQIGVHHASETLPCHGEGSNASRCTRKEIECGRSSKHLAFVQQILFYLLCLVTSNIILFYQNAYLDSPLEILWMGVILKVGFCLPVIIFPSRMLIRRYY
jgi:hypothetical protein